MAQTPEYIQWPGSATFPGAHTFPHFDDRADGAKVVHSHLGWEWEETTNEYLAAVTDLATSAIEASIRRVNTIFGKVYYISGNKDTKPEFPGEAAGATARVQDPVTRDIVAEWRWTGSRWERMHVRSEQISNLDVGKLTAGSAFIDDLVARKIAAASGKFVELDVSQLKVAGQANIDKAVVKEIWSTIVRGKEGEYEKLRAGMLGANSVVAGNVAAGAVDAKALTADALNFKTARGVHLVASRIQSNADVTRGLLIDGDLMQMRVDGRITMEINRTGESVWRSPITGAAIRIIPRGMRDAPVLQFRTPQIEHYEHLPEVWVETGSQMDRGYGVGAYLVMGAELRLNKSGRALLQVGPHNHWKLGNEYGTGGNSSIFGGEGTIYMNANNRIEVGTFNSHTKQIEMYTGHLWLRSKTIKLGEIPHSSGGLDLKMDRNWQIFYEGSARALKADIRDVDVDPWRLLNVPVRDWVDRYELKQHSDYWARRAEGVDVADLEAYKEYPRREPGLVAEEVRDAGLDEYVSYMDGQVVGLKYDRLWTLLIPVVRDLKERLDRLEKEVAR